MPPTIDLTIAEARRLTEKGSTLPVPLARKLLDEFDRLSADYDLIELANERLKKAVYGKVEKVEKSKRRKQKE